MLFLFLLFLERCFGTTFCQFAIYIVCTLFGYYFGYRFGQRFRHLQILIQIHKCISRLKNEFRNLIRNCAMYLNILPKKTIIGKTLAIESNFLEILQNKIRVKEENLSVWCDVSKKKCWFGFLLMTRKKFQSFKFLI